VFVFVFVFWFWIYFFKYFLFSFFISLRFHVFPSCFVFTILWFYFYFLIIIIVSSYHHHHHHHHHHNHHNNHLLFFSLSVGRKISQARWSPPECEAAANWPILRMLIVWRRCLLPLTLRSLNPESLEGLRRCVCVCSLFACDVLFFFRYKTLKQEKNEKARKQK